MPELLEITLSERLRQNDATAFEQLYDECYPAIAGYVQQNSGNEQDAEDVFQETMIVVLQNLRKPDFVLSSSVKTYMYAVARNLWLKRLRDSKPATAHYDEELHGDLLHEQTGAGHTQHNTGILEKILNKITNHCRHILVNLFLNNEPMERFMKRMGWKNKHTAANQKYKCLEQVKKYAGTIEES